MAFNLQAVLRLRDEMSDKIQRIARQFEQLESVASKTMNSAAKAVAGANGSIYEQQKAVSKLKSAYMTLGSTINTTVTPAIAAMAVGVGVFGAKYEEMTNKFQAQTLTPNVQMPEYKNLMMDVQVSTGAEYNEVGQVFSFLKNQTKLAGKDLANTAEMAFNFADIWGDGGAQAAIDSYKGLHLIMKKTGVVQDQAADMLSTSLIKHQGDIQEATRDVLNNANAWKEQTKASTKGAQSYENTVNAMNQGAIGKFGEALRQLGAAFAPVYDAMQPKLEKIAEALTAMAKAATNFLQTHPAFVQFLANFAIFGSMAIVAVGALSTFVGVMMTLNKAVKSAKFLKVFDIFIRALAGLPRMVAAAFPMLINVLLAIPALMLRAILMFVRLNPVLTLLMIAGKLIYDQWDRFAPLFNKIWESVKGAIKPIIDLFSDMTDRLGPALSDMFDEIGSVLTDSLYVALQILEPVINGIANGIQALVAWLRGDMVGASNEAKEAFAAFKKVWETPLETAFGEASEGVKLLGIAIAGATIAWGLWRTAVLAASIAQGILNAVMLAGPFGWIVLIIGAVVLAALYLAGSWDALKAATAALWYGMMASFQEGYVFILQKIQDILKAVEPIAKMLPDSVSEGLANMQKSVATELDAATKKVEDFSKKAQDAQKQYEKLKQAQNTVGPPIPKTPTVPPSPKTPEQPKVPALNQSVNLIPQTAPASQEAVKAAVAKIDVTPATNAIKTLSTNLSKLASDVGAQTAQFAGAFTPIVTAGQTLATSLSTFSTSITPQIVSSGRLLATNLNAFAIHTAFQTVAFVTVMQSVMTSAKLVATNFNALAINAGRSAGNLVGAMTGVISGANSLASAFVVAAARVRNMRVPTVSGTLPTVDGSHANGLPYVPKDGYIAELHRGERVLTAQENKAYSSGNKGGATSSGGVTVNINGLTVRENADVDRIAHTILSKIIAANAAGA